MKYAVLVAVLAGATLFTSPAAADEQQVGAIVFNFEEGECNLLWLSPTGQSTRLGGAGTELAEMFVRWRLSALLSLGSSTSTAELFVAWLMLPT